MARWNLSEMGTSPLAKSASIPTLTPPKCFSGDSFPVIVKPVTVNELGKLPQFVTFIERTFGSNAGFVLQSLTSDECRAAVVSHAIQK